MNYSVTGYNPYMNYGSYSLNNRVAARNIAFTSQPNTVSLSSNNQTQATKTGLSKNAKLGLGALALVGIGAAAYILSRGKVGSKSVEQLAQHVEFQPAKTIEEARAFANKQLNVRYLHEDKANLDMINTVNEWLYREKVVAKNNIPDFVHFVEKDIENPLELTDKIFHEGKGYNSIGINVNLINKFDELFERVFNPRGEINLCKLIKKNSKGVYEVVKPEYRCENLDKLVYKLNAYGKNSTFKDKMEIFDGFSEAIPYLDNVLAGKSVKMNTFSSDGPFLHEIGHLLHQDTYKLWKEANKEGSKIYQEFQQDNIQRIARQVSDYATSDPLEFVAETYKRLRRGQSFSDDVMTLYKKYSGPALS